MGNIFVKKIHTQNQWLTVGDGSQIDYTSGTCSAIGELSIKLKVLSSANVEFEYLIGKV